MLARGAEGADSGQYAAQQIELIGNERIYGGKVFSVGIELLFDAVIEQDQVLDDGCFLIV